MLQHLGQLDAEWFAERQVVDLYWAVLSRWRLARRRESGQARVRAVNPTIAAARCA